MNPDFWRERRVFVTGHSGFKGTWLSKWLSMLGATVTGYSLPENDVRDLDRLRDAMAAAKPEIVFHLAAQALVRTSYDDPMTTFTTNLNGTVNLLEALRGTPSARAAILITSDKCYANDGGDRPFREEDRLGGPDPYSASKACAEFAIEAYRRSFLDAAGVRVISVRAGNVIGGGDVSRDRLVPDLVRAFRAGKRARIRSIEATRPWQFVLDALHGYLLIAERAAAGENLPGAFNFGPSEQSSRTVRWLADVMAERWGEGAAWEAIDEAGVHEAPTLALDSARARRFLGWEPLLDGAGAVTWTADWYKSGEDLTTTQIERYMEMIPQ
ncbi:MAG TPA: CDP-glucose 4,6-dehydratase [Allosphingosinicella sp.]|nr:CDP-glucose 4,6-dehydratase [Allosphingosinicella sp.]